MEQISSRDNRWVKEYVRLAGSKRAREETGRFVVEGVKLCGEAAASGVPVEAVFVTPACRERCAALLEQLADGARVFEIPAALADKMSEQKSPQGIFVIARKLDKTLSRDTIEKDGRYLFLCGLQDAGNVGTMIRTAEAMGISGVIVTRDTCDPFSPKVIRGSMGAVFRMPLLVAEEARSFVEELEAAHVATYATVLAEDAIPLTQLRFERPAVLLVGNEGNGLDDAVSRACRCRVTIPMQGRAESLNAAMAAGIFLWEMTRE